MFSIFRKKKSTPFPFQWLGADMHSHLIPGIDDGSPDMETSVSLIKGFAALGYKKIITTPHVMGDLYRNNSGIISAGCSRVKEELAKQGIETGFSAAAEYLMDDNFDELLELKENLLTLKKNYVLVEFSFISPPIEFKKKLFNMQIGGYIPVLAHPERYAYFHRNPRNYDELKNIGCLLQPNLLSFAGYYGKIIQETAFELLDKGLVDFLGTDLHHDKHLAALQGLQLSPAFQKLFDSGILKNPEL
jgi:protein-tyrosine phosphatase